MKSTRSIWFLSFVLFLCTFWSILQHETRTRPEPHERGAWGAFEWWYGQRAQPFDLIPPQGFQRAATYARTAMKHERLREGMRSSESAWKSLGPINIGGRVLAIAVDPTDRNTVWVGSASGGLWKSVTGGIGANGWSYVATGFPTLSVSAVALDPANPSTIYIGSGEISLYHRPLIGTPGARASYGMGILKSTDGGASWAQTGLTWEFSEITAVQRIVVNPANPQTVFAATSEGTYRSRDGGATWSQVHAVAMAMDLVMSPADTSRLYVACGSLNSSANPGLYTSLDAGNSWTPLTNGLPLTNFGRTGLAISRSNANIVYAGIANASSSAMLGLYKTTNGGGSWALASSSNYVGSQGWYNNVVAVHPTNPDSVYCSGFNIHRSVDGGSTLPSVSTTAVHVDHHAIAFDPVDAKVMYFGTDGGVFKSTDGGTTYMNVNNGFLTTQFYPGFANSASDTNLFIGGLQDNGTLKYMGNGYWQQIFGGDGGWCAIDPTHPNILYYEFQYLQLYRSVTGGVSAAPIMSGLPIGASNANFIPPFVMSPSSPNILYAGNKNVYKTTNSGLLWFAPNGGANFNGTPVACIGVSKTSPDTLLAATGTGALGVTPAFEVFSSVNGGQSWTNVTAGLPNRYPTDLEFDPSNGGTVYLTYSGFGTPHVFRSTNVGQTWTDISANLPDIPHQAVVVDPEYADHLYVGTDLGVYRSTDGGGVWEDFATGMPPTMILDLTISRQNNALRASTFGSGLYQRKLHRTPILALVSPNGGEKYVSGESAEITWSQMFLDDVRLEYSSNNGASWNLIADGVPAAPESYAWTVPNLTTPDALVRIIDATGAEASDTSDARFGVFYNPDVASGWNLVSVDRAVPDAQTAEVFPTSISDAFRYSSGYVEDDSLDHGVGYWLKFSEPQFTDLVGDSLHSDTISVRAGWNIIGSIAHLVPVTEIVQSPESIVVSLFYGFRGGYSPSDSIVPKRAYWVKVTSDGSLVLPDPFSAGYAPKRSARRVTEPAGSLSIVDGGGNSQTLEFTERPAGRELYEMPPAPPSGVFDARFASGTMLESFAGRRGTEVGIEIRNAIYPVTITWNLPGRSGAPFTIVAAGVRTPVEGTGRTILAQASDVALSYGSEVDIRTIPAEFALHQNYPNPFNPSTTIRYDLPAETRVRIRIFDLLGQEVATLADAVEQAGSRSVTWNAGGSPSGIYFCTLETPDRRATRKLILLR